MSKVEFEFIVQISHIRLYHIAWVSEWKYKTWWKLNNQSYEITILSFVFSPYHPFVIHFVKSNIFLYLEILGDNPYLIVILNHGGNIKPHFLLKSSSKLQIPHLSSLYSEQVQWVSILFSQFKHSSASSMYKIITDGISESKDR